MATGTRARPVKAKVAPKPVQISVDVDEFTFNELVSLEEMLGRDVTEVFRPRVVRDRDGNAINAQGAVTVLPKEFRWETVPTAREILCMITVVLRRENPQLSLEEAGDVPVSQVVLNAPKRKL